jgi:hypothetical protein
VKTFIFEKLCIFPCQVLVGDALAIKLDAKQVSFNIFYLCFSGSISINCEFVIMPLFTFSFNLVNFLVICLYFLIDRTIFCI